MVRVGTAFAGRVEIFEEDDDEDEDDMTQRLNRTETIERKQIDRKAFHSEIKNTDSTWPYTPKIYT